MTCPKAQRKVGILSPQCPERGQMEPFWKEQTVVPSWLEAKGGRGAGEHEAEYTCLQQLFVLG